MKIGFVVNDVATEELTYTTTHMTLRALRRGHQAWHIGVGDFTYEKNGQVTALATRAPARDYTKARDFLAALQSEEAIREVITVDDLDVLMLRNDPAEDVFARPWARLAGINFGRLAEQRGVIVLNSPDGLYHAVNKLYLQLFPEEIRPRTVITRDRKHIAEFVEAEGGRAIVKPLAGSGGHNVFLVKSDDYNFNQIINAVSQEGYMIVQQVLAGAEKGDTRIFLLDGELITVDGKVAAVQRQPAAGDFRSNITAGGSPHLPEITEDMRRIVDLVRPNLLKDGMFFVGLDVIGDKVMEINVFSPGGLFNATRLAGVDFITKVVEALEEKVRARK